MLTPEPTTLVFALLDAIANGVFRLLKRSEGFELAETGVDPGLDQMHVGILEARKEHPAAELDDVGVGARLGQHGLFVAYRRDDPIVIDRHGFGQGRRGVHGADLGVGNDERFRNRGGGAAKRRSGQKQAGQRSQRSLDVSRHGDAPFLSVFLTTTPVPPVQVKSRMNDLRRRVAGSPATGSSPLWPVDGQSSVTQTDLDWVLSISASRHLSRPWPESFQPPQGWLMSPFM